MDADIWVLYGRNAGDNRQIAALAEATGLRWRGLKLGFNTLSHSPAYLTPPTLATLKPASRALFKKPWPRTVIAAGKRAVPAARWVRAASGGQTRLVQVGRPWAPLSWFDLVVTTPQYGLPSDRANVVTNLFTLGSAAPAATVAGHDDLASLPRPIVGVLVGGDSHPYTLDAHAAARLARRGLDSARADGGTAVFVAGPRTSKAALAAIEAEIALSDRPAVLFPFGRDPQDYAQTLSAADRLIVTGDSAAMIAEAATVGVEVEIFPLPRLRDARARAALAGQDLFDATPAGRALLKRMIGLGLVAAPRDLPLYASALQAAGLLAGGDGARRRAEIELGRAAMIARHLSLEPREATLAAGRPAFAPLTSGAA